jgi:hypothetical protein
LLADAVAVVSSDEGGALEGVDNGLAWRAVVQAGALDLRTTHRLIALDLGVAVWGGWISGILGEEVGFLGPDPHLPVNK